jgi:hypothetical protein
MSLEISMIRRILQKKNYYGASKISKHLLGIVKICEDLGLECTIYYHMDNIAKPIISHHGAKGSRFLDGMYACQRGISCILGITIVQDTGFSSDHDLVISKCDLGLDHFEVSHEKEKRFNFRSIMNIPVTSRHGHDHPSLNDKVFEGIEFKIHAELYQRIQDTVCDPQLKILSKITEIKTDLESFEQQIICRKKENITVAERNSGKLIQRLPSDALFIHDTSTRFFSLIHEVCRNANLATMRTVFPIATLAKKERGIANRNILLGTASIPISKELDELFKHTENVYQRIQLIRASIQCYQRTMHHVANWKASKTYIIKALWRLQNQQQPLLNSMERICQLCEDIAEDRKITCMLLKPHEIKKL